MRVLVACMVLATAASADSWKAPEPRGWHSDDVGFALEVFVPGSRHHTAERGNTAFMYAVKSRAPTLDFKLVWKGPLANPRAPYEAIVTTDGFLITLDEWGGTGYDNAVVIYSPAGKVVRAYHMDNLMVPDEVRSRGQSVSSRDWRRGATYHHDAKKKRFQIHLGTGVLDFSLADGTHRWIEVWTKKITLGAQIKINQRNLDLATLTDFPQEMSAAVEKLVFAVLLSAIKKRAETIEMKCGRDRFVVDFLVDGVRTEEMRPPIELRAPMFDQLKLMASDEGVIELAIGDDHRMFTVAFSEQGALHRCEIRVGT